MKNGPVKRKLVKTGRSKTSGIILIIILKSTSVIFNFFIYLYSLKRRVTKLSTKQLAVLSPTVIYLRHPYNRYY